MTKSEMWNTVIGVIMGSQLQYKDKRELIDFVRQVEADYEERENPEPLTIEELREMDGEPVWIDDWWEDSHGWEFSLDAEDYFAGEKRTTKGYGSIWVAYRHKPKEELK